MIWDDTHGGNFGVLETENKRDRWIVLNCDSNFEMCASVLSLQRTINQDFTKTSLKSREVRCKWRAERVIALAASCILIGRNLGPRRRLRGPYLLHHGDACNATRRFTICSSLWSLFIVTTSASYRRGSASGLDWLINSAISYRSYCIQAFHEYVSEKLGSHEKKQSLVLVL